MIVLGKSVIADGLGTLFIAVAHYRKVLIAAHLLNTALQGIALTVIDAAAD